MRTPIIAANWKMHKTLAEAEQFVRDFLPKVKEVAGVEMVLCPTFTALATVGNALKGANVALGGQNMYKEVKGAFTGEISAPMLKDAGCTYVILGHSERRAIFGESDALVGEKVKAAFAHGLTPILCVGESLAEREAGQTGAVNRRQFLAAVESISAEQMASMVIAYEPVWAIGTGKNCDTADAQSTIAAIRALVAERFDVATADKVRIQYGGSVKPNNIADYMTQPDIDGALVGGAGLEAESFAAICGFAR